MLFLLLKRLNTSIFGRIEKRSPTWNVRERPKSNVKNALSLRRWLRPQSMLFTNRVFELVMLQGAPEGFRFATSVIGCAECACIRTSASKPHGRLATV